MTVIEYNHFGLSLGIHMKIITKAVTITHFGYLLGYGAMPVSLVNTSALLGH